MIYKNVASQKIAVFAYTASTGAAKTGDAANITAYISKDFAAGAATDDTNPTELDATNMPGWYVFTLTQAETNAEVLVLAAKSSTSGVLCDQVQVLTQDAAISSRASQTSVDTIDDFLDTEIAAILEDTGTTLDTLIKDIPTVAEFEARTLAAADYVVVGDTLAAVTTVGSVTGAVGSVAANGITATSIAADAINAAAVKADAVTKIQSGLASQTSVNDLPTNAELATALAGADDTVLAAIAALNNLSSAGAQAAAAAALTAYGAALQSTLTTVAGYLDTEVAAILADTNELQTDWANGGRLDLLLDGAMAPTASAVADAVWDEAIAGHAAAGSTGAALSAAGSAGDPWSTALPGSYTSGQAGHILSTIKAVTDDIDTSDVTVVAAVSGTAITIQRGDTTSIALTGLGDIAPRTKLWFTVKNRAADADTAAILLVEETAGLTVVNGAAYTTVAHGTITVSNEVAGDLTIALNAAVTAQLVPDQPLRWDVQMLTATGVTTLNQGDATVAADITRATA